MVKGCSQRKDFDYKETYAPVTRLTTIRVLLSLINKRKLFAVQLDVKNAFLHGTIKEEIYMMQPEGFLSKEPNLVCRLHKSLYGLKQAPRAWNDRFNEFMRKIGFRRSEYDKCLYIKIARENELYLLLYVDDIILTGNNEHELNSVKRMLSLEFDMTDMGRLKSFLGVKIEFRPNGMFLSQKVYTENLLKRFGMEHCNPKRTPLNTNHAEETEDEKIITEEKPYRELVGCLSYLMLNTRPDICAAVHYFSRFQNNAKECHWNGLKGILRYLRGTTDFGLFFKRTSEDILIGHADSDWAGDRSRKSTTGYLFKVYDATVCWVTKKQTSVALSSTEAEYVALAMAAAELVWLKNLLTEFQVETGTVVMYEDNQSCIHSVHKTEHQRLKHVDVKYNFIRDLVLSNEMRVEYIPTKEQIADCLTKALPTPQFEKLRSYMGIEKHSN